MSLIQKVGGQGIAEIILSQAITSAILPNCYFADLKAYGHVDEQDDVAYVFCEESKQYLAYKPATKTQYVLLRDLKREMGQIVGELVA